MDLKTGLRIHWLLHPLFEEEPILKGRKKICFETKKKSFTLPPPKVRGTKFFLLKKLKIEKKIFLTNSVIRLLGLKNMILAFVLCLAVTLASSSVSKTIFKHCF
jgi:hypothetical protein